MNKQEFLEKLKSRLGGLPEQDIEERTAFYSEMIDDYIEDGLSQEEAVDSVGDIDDIVAQIVTDTPLTKLVKQKIKPDRKLKIWEIVLIALGFPIWFSLIVALFAVVISVYVSVWAVIISLWSTFAAFAVTGVAGIGAAIIFICRGFIASGLFVFGGAMVCAGLAIFMFFGCKASTKALLKLTVMMVSGVKNALIKKEEA